MQKKKLTNNLFDPACERIILSCILQYGHEVFFDIDSTIKSEYFYFPENHILYEVLKTLIVKENIKKPDIVSILAKIDEVDKSYKDKYVYDEYIHALLQNKISIENYRPFLTRFTKLGLAKALKARLQESIDTIDSITGEETILQILNKAEAPISSFTESLVQEDEISNLGDDISDYIDYLAIEQPETRGIPTGYPRYDKYLGGGLVWPGIHLLGARAKVGKSQICLNIANNVTKIDIPVLYLDTELTKNIIMDRWSSLLSQVPMGTITTGAFANDMTTANEVSKSIAAVKNKRKFYYFNISGRHHTEWISIIRRFLMKIVGFNENGQANPCLIILDYIKMMNLEDAANFAEHQYLGQIITDLHNVCVKYNIPIFAAVQLNRDGITNEDQGVIAGSDRLIALCSSFSILKNKSPEELSDPNNSRAEGDKKLRVIATRFGAGTTDGEYINMKCFLEKSTIIEGNTNIENNRNSSGVREDAPANINI